MSRQGAATPGEYASERSLLGVGRLGRLDGYLAGRFGAVIFA